MGNVDPLPVTAETFLPVCEPWNWDGEDGHCCHRWGQKPTPLDMTLGTPHQSRAAVAAAHLPEWILGSGLTGEA